MPQEVKVTEIVKLPSTNRERMGKYDRQVTCTTTDEPPRRFLVVVPDEAFSDETLRAAIVAEMKVRSAVIGKSFPVP